MDRTPQEWREHALAFVTSFATLARIPGQDGAPEKIRLRRGEGDLMHMFGYYFEQNRQHLKDLNSLGRLTLAADTLRYIADHLDPD